MTEDGRGRVTSFEDLDVFRRAYRVSLEVHRASLGFPRIEQSALADQLRRASKSICANIAEGLADRSGRSPSSGGFCRWPWVPRTRCGCGCAMPSISAISSRRIAALARRVSRCLADAAGAFPQCGRVTSVTRRPSSVLRSGSGAFRRPVKASREACWRYRKCEC